MKYPCIFSTEFLKKDINDRLWKKDRSTPFAAFQQTWRKVHCPLVNPYGADCPYEPEDCAIAYWKVAETTLDEAEVSRIGLFRAMAKRTGLDRADNKPLSRDNRTYGQQEGPGDLRRGSGAGPVDDLGSPSRSAEAEVLRRSDDRGVARGEPLGMRGGDYRPQRLGDLLRGDGAGPRTHPYRRNERQEGGDHDGDRRDPLPPSPPRRLGDEPPS